MGMKILNKKYFESMKKYRDDNNLQNELTDDDCICYANMFSVYFEITDKKYSFDEMFQTYDFITDVIDGLRPDIMIELNDKYRNIYRLLRRYSITKNLDKETRKKLAFLIYQAKCIMIMDEETMEPTWNMWLFEKGTNNFLEEYEYELKEYPETYEIKETLSDITSDYFGLTANNPIELISVGAQYQYLNILLTDDGKDILYERVGTVTHSNGETIIDVYNIYSKKILGKKKITTLYISGYGYENTVIAPKGFRFMTDEEFKSRH